ncbi:hypothetical protein D9M68_791440 [compost metagenome]
MQELSSTPVLIPVRLDTSGLQAAGLQQGDVNFPGFAKGTPSAPPGLAWVGERGPELVAFGGGERVFTAAASAALASRMAGLRMPGYSDAGLVEAAMSVPGAQPGRDLGRVDLHAGDHTYSLLAERDSFDQILRATALKRGRTHKR